MTKGTKYAGNAIVYATDDHKPQDKIEVDRIKVTPTPFISTYIYN